MIPIEYNLRSLVARPLTSGAALVAIASAVFVFACTEMLISSVRASSGTRGVAENVIVLARGASSEATSRIRESETHELDLFEELVPLDGESRGAGELVLNVRAGASHEPVTVRGITPLSFAARPYVRIRDGRRLTPGSDQVMVGSAVEARLVRLGLIKDGQIDLGAARRFPVVATFAAGSAPQAAEVWMDIHTVRAFFSDASALSSYTARLHTARDLDRLKARIVTDARLDLDVVLEQSYFSEHSHGLALVLEGIALVMSTVMIVGTLLGAMAIMFALVRGRLREIATLKALGFGGSHILRAFLAESCAVGAAGGLLGMLAATVMPWIRFAAIEAGGDEVVAVALSPSGATWLWSSLLALALGLLGGVVPAVFAVHVSALETKA